MDISRKLLTLSVVSIMGLSLSTHLMAMETEGDPEEASPPTSPRQRLQHTHTCKKGFSAFLEGVEPGPGGSSASNSPAHTASSSSISFPPPGLSHEDLMTILEGDLVKSNVPEGLRGTTVPTVSVDEKGDVFHGPAQQVVHGVTLEVHRYDQLPTHQARVSYRGEILQTQKAGQAKVLSIGGEYVIVTHKESGTFFTEKREAIKSLPKAVAILYASEGGRPAATMGPNVESFICIYHLYDEGTGQRLQTSTGNASLTLTIARDKK